MSMIWFEENFVSNLLSNFKPGIILILSNQSPDPENGVAYKKKCVWKRHENHTSVWVLVNLKKLVSLLKNSVLPLIDSAKRVLSAQSLRRKSTSSVLLFPSFKYLLHCFGIGVSLRWIRIRKVPVVWARRDLSYDFIEPLWYRSVTK